MKPHDVDDINLDTCRKRYAKKVGDQWGVTRDGGDFPIYAITFVGLIATAWFALVYVPTL
jgi:hypothetical protein